MNEYDLNESHLDSFEKAGFAVLDEFMSESDALALRDFIFNQAVSGLLRKAGIGRQHDFAIEESRRGDFIQWIDSGKAPEAAFRFLEKIDALRVALNRSFFLGLQDFETHYTWYPPETRYEKHVDRHRSGSSRRVSFVFYLNPGWVPDHGGELQLYEQSGKLTRIEPLFSRLAVFLSEMEHEVLLTRHDRLSITGWMRDTSLI
ncbi:MAG: 2OG-Fe(II) oxygenase [Flavobacteriales bacterium]|jgi:SM-20-related protein